MISLCVNGTRHELQVAPDVPLIFVLRNDLGLKSPKLGCGLEQCGACRVLLDGRAVPSCRLPVADAQGKQIVTLEGLGTQDAPHALQRAFLAENAGQCGYCVAGILISAAALLARSPRPDTAQIKAGLAGHLCRCGSQPRFIRAIARAAQAAAAEGEPQDG